MDTKRPGKAVNFHCTCAGEIIKDKHKDKMQISMFFGCMKTLRKTPSQKKNPPMCTIYERK